MKNLISFLTIFAFALLLVAGNASAGGVNLLANDMDDSLLNTDSRRSHSFFLRNNSSTDMKSDLTVSSNNGDNFIGSGDDVKLANITTGDSDVKVSETADLNGLDVIYTSDNASSDVNNFDLDVYDVDDSLLNFTEKVEDEEEVDNHTYSKVDLDTEVTDNNGNNGVMAAGDVGEDSTGITIDSGNSIIDVLRTTVTGLTRVTYSR